MKTLRTRPFPEKIPGQLELWNREIWTRLREAGDLPAEFRKPGHLPPELCQLNTARVRKFLKAPCRWIDEKHTEGVYQVHFVTIVLTDWIFEPGKLSASAIIKTRDWVTRRLRRLGGECRYAAVGIVDISFNDGSRVGEASAFAVHAHVLLALKIDAKLDATTLTKWAFNLKPEHRDRRWTVRRPRKVQVVARGPGRRRDVKRVRDYMGRALFPFGNHMRISEFDNSRQTRDKPLNIPQLLELLAVLQDCPPERRLILSGFRREGERIVRRKQTYPLRPTIKLPLQEPKASKPQTPSDGDYDDYYDT